MKYKILEHPAELRFRIYGKTLEELFINAAVNSQKSKVVADLIGYPVDHFNEDIKAVTYQDLNIQKIDGIWQTILVFDI